eukprot:SAG11_NODE_13904_length_634_cov_0.583178_1_plen_88_part_01
MGEREALAERGAAHCTHPQARRRANASRWNGTQAQKYVTDARQQALQQAKSELVTQYETKLADAERRAKEASERAAQLQAQLSAAPAG